MEFSNKALDEANKAIENIKDEDFKNGVPEGVVAVFVNAKNDSQIISKSQLTPEQIMVMLSKLTEVQAYLFQSIINSRPKK